SAPDPGSGIGRRKGSAAHQHAPPSPQSKACPQWAHMILRGVMASAASIGRSSREATGATRFSLASSRDLVRRLMIRLAAEEACDLPGACVLEVAQLLAADGQDGIDRHVADLAARG